MKQNLTYMYIHKKEREGYLYENGACKKMLVIPN